MIQLDGAAGEGGGQILRSALTLALLGGKSFRLKRIRAGRARPGLAAQHLACVHAAAKVGRATVTGAALGSTELSFRPHAVAGGDFEFPIGTAGATALVVQTVALPLLLRADGPSTVTVTGGTHAAHAPTFEYLAETWAGTLRAMGLDATAALHKCGFYPKGGGKIVAEFRPSAARPLTLAATPSAAWSATCSAASLPQATAGRARERLRERFDAAGVAGDIDTHEWPGGPGLVVTIRLAGRVAPTLVTALGERGRRAEAVADEAFDAAWAFRTSGAAVDPHAADQIVLPLAHAGGESAFTVSEVTQHLLTNIEVIRAFTDTQFAVTGELGSPGAVSVTPGGV